VTRGGSDGRARNLTPPLEIIEGGTKFEQVSTLAPGERQRRLEIGLHGNGVGVCVGTEPQ
jgi:hypothetical protein